MTSKINTYPGEDAQTAALAMSLQVKSVLRTLDINLTEPTPENPRLQNAAKNMAGYLDQDLAPASLIQGNITTPDGWNTEHAAYLIRALAYAIETAGPSLPLPGRAAALRTLLELTLTMTQATCRPESRPHLDRQARGPGREEQMRIYVASSWRNARQPEVVRALSQDGHQTYDFHNPHPSPSAFQWSEIDPDWQDWQANSFRQALEHPLAERGFQSDLNAIRQAHALVLVLPCGRSAHLEAGWAAGQGKPVCVLLDQQNEPELMYKMASHLATSLPELLAWTRRLKTRAAGP